MLSEFIVEKVLPLRSAHLRSNKGDHHLPLHNIRKRKRSSEIQTLKSKMRINMEKVLLFLEWRPCSPTQK